MGLLAGIGYAPSGGAPPHRFPQRRPVMGDGLGSKYPAKYEAGRTQTADSSAGNTSQCAAI